jgi:trypsin-like peptidase
METDRDIEPTVGTFAIPVANSVGTGTGFLAHSRGEIAFYTVAHNLGPYPKRNDGLLAVGGWEWLDTELEVLASSVNGTPVGRLPIVMTTDETERPGEANLGFASLSPEQGRLTDAARFDPRLGLQVLQELRMRFDIVDLDEAALQVDQGEPLFCLGYPAAEAPYGGARAFDREASRCHGAYLGRGPTYDWASMRATDGYSGGPVFTRAGRFAGMVAGSYRRLTIGRMYELSWLVKPADLIALGPSRE